MKYKSAKDGNLSTQISKKRPDLKPLPVNKSEGGDYGRFTKGAVTNATKPAVNKTEGGDHGRYVKGDTQIQNLMKEMDFENWYKGTYLSKKPGVEAKTNNPKERDFAKIDQLRTQGNEILEKMAAQFEIVKGKSSNDKFVGTVLRSGTAKDRSAALALLAQEYPIFNIEALKKLAQMATKKMAATSAVESLKEVMLNLLPARKLKSFDQQPIENDLPINLAYWAFEEKLKTIFGDFVRTLEAGTQDPLPHTRRSSVKVLYDILSEKSEGERTILSALVNKLRDPDPKVCAYVPYLLSILLEKNPQMKIHVATEVELFTFRPNVGSKAQYYAMIFLNQIVLSNKNPELTEKLLTIYFTLFKALVNVEEKNLNTKLLEAVLTGIRRAFPFIDVDQKMYDEQIDSLFKLVHITKFNTALQTLQVLFLITKTRVDIRGRFYRALYSALCNTSLYNSTSHLLFFDLFFKAMRDDEETERVMAFIKRLLQICLYQTPNFVCSALIMISHIHQLKPEIAKSISHSLNFKNGKTDDEKDAYDPFKRDPLFANADKSSLWELNVLVHHYHPSVVMFAENLLRHELVAYKGNPLEDFSQKSFLDRFVYKNPKSNPAPRGISKMQTAHTARGEPAVTSKSFVNKKESQIRGEEMFFYQYFKAKKEKTPTVVKVAPELDESEDEEEEEEEVEFNESGADDFDEDGADLDDIGEGVGDFDSDNADDLDDVDEDLDVMFEESDVKGKNKGAKPKAPKLPKGKTVFADADDFADILEKSGDSGVNAKLTKWEERGDKRNFRAIRNAQKKRGPGFSSNSKPAKRQKK
eukprot:TRINITY_DN4568_c0_g1_i2.p1 TRINITY_DN4568_c0_g1~~TRINITY_DN4568_c0_g1_i2.p1  ORF type:complete len:811 (+),score=275.66 TRINITY_DN4568_c0_g1_i2:101-2533(+)